MPDVQVFGADTGLDRKYLPLALVGAGVIAYFLFRPKGGGGTPAPSFSVPQSDVEFANLTLQAMDQLNRLNAASGIEQRMIDTQFQLDAGLVPGLLRQCVPYDQWYSMSDTQRNGVDQQIRQGKMLKIPTAQGFCFTPTSIGIRGNEPPVKQQISRNFFRSKETITGPAGSYTPYAIDPGTPGISTTLDTLAQLYANHFAVQMGGTPYPDARNSGKTGPTVPHPYDPGINPYPYDPIPNQPYYPRNTVNPNLIWVDSGSDPQGGIGNVTSSSRYGISPVNVIWGDSPYG